MYADFESIAGSWLLTYTLHSTLLLGLAWLVTRRPGESPARREVIWKAALVGGLVTATVQVVLPFQPLSGMVSLAPRLERAAGTAAPAEADFAVVPWTGVRPETTPSGTQARGA